ncbi:helix-turn-helix domain-containing protein [Saccharothrix syringae]|uniref:hypothetical protein n=1 Tax=Saccharothrix syringae TaxID=103733 RepID=UPI000AF2C36C|nr:hypothetical protein [Saccharothrix syringae]
MTGLTVQGPVARGRDPRRVDVPVGGTRTFGTCACGSCDWDLPIAGEPDFRGALVADGAVWWVVNLSDREPLFVASVDHPGEATAVRPGERLPFGFDMAIVTPSRGPATVSVTVFASVPEAPVPLRPRCPAVHPGVPALDPDARYYAVLEALCEPGGVLAPTSADIAGRLGLSPRAVDAHIDYLVRKLDLPEPATRRHGWKRMALIAHVRRSGVMPLARTA